MCYDFKLQTLPNDLRVWKPLNLMEAIRSGNTRKAMGYTPNPHF